MNIVRVFLDEADALALTDVHSSGARSSRSHRHLARNVCRLAIEMRRMGVRTGDSVIILCATHIAAVEAILAAMAIGAVAVPIDSLLGMDPILAIVEALLPAFCVCDGPLVPTLEAALARTCHAFLSTRQNTGKNLDYLSYDSLVEKSVANIEFPEIPGDRLALITYTSGSSGRPKGVTFTHGQLDTFFRYHTFLHSQFHEPQMAPSSNPVVSVLPLTHLGGLALGLQGLVSRRPTYLMDAFLPEPFLRLVADMGCQSIMLVPSMYRSLLKEAALRELDLSRLRFCITLGEPCSPGLAQQITAALGHVTVVSAYGLTECFTGLGHLRSELAAGRVKPGSCGTHAFGEIRLVDADGQDADTFGELVVRNESVHACYLDNELNASRIVNGWFRTRDLFFKDPDGCFFYRGRCDDMFICNGKNVYPAQLETLFTDHPAVELACATSVQTGDGDVVPALFIVPRAAISETEIIDFAARNGPRYAIPRLVHFTPSAPKLGPGKIDRAEVARVLQGVYDRLRG
jgi:long-chain acyl-CoA synthetase